MASLISLDQVYLTTASQRPQKMQRKGMLNHPILQDISIDLAAGEVVGIIGATGAGKTSVLRLLNRLVDPTAGKLYWQGQDYASVAVSALRQQIMLIPQEPKLLGMSAVQAIEYGLQLRNLAPQEIQQRSVQWQQRLQIPSDWLKKTESSLSLGQRQWITIARGLICETSVLLLDEPTAHLDGNYAEHLRQLIVKIQRDDRLIVITSHDVDWLASVCSRVLYLQQGQLVQDMTQDKVDWIDLKLQIKVIEKTIEDEWN